ncbi:TIGR00366 family protein, partial [Streptomyces brasiliscabiei]|uniref:TIGR00366 family protein n=1 Tax=Streptomyces brasiliscabiei TaxID=2736302 RepID=UPI003014BB11
EHFSEQSIGVISTSETLFSGFNIAIVLGLFIIMPLVNRYMLPNDSDSVYVDQNKLIEPQNKEVALTHPADHIEHSRVL